MISQRSFDDRTAKRVVDPQHIIAAFLREAKLDRAMLAGNALPRPLAHRRHELMWLLRELTHLTLAEIGAALGGLDPTTVRAGIDTVADRCTTDPSLREWLQSVRAGCLLEGRSAKAAARRVITDGQPSDAQRLAIAVVGAASVLASPDLSDSEARRVALDLITRAQEPSDGRSNPV